MKTKIIFTVITIVLVVAVVTKLKSNKVEVEHNVYKTDPDKKVLVQGITIVKEQLDKTYSYTGSFSPNREILLIPQAQGETKGIFFEEGETVSAGKLLLQIDDDILQAQFISAETEYDVAKRNFERYEKASQSDGVSKMQFDDFTLRFRNAESKMKQLAKQIRMHRMTAPFSGTITLKDVEVGSVIGNNPVGRLTDLSQLKLEISVPENEINLFKEGDRAEITSDLYTDKLYVGKVEYVADRADASHNYAVKIVIKNDNTGLKAGMYGTARLNKGLNSEALVIPRSALVGSAKKPQVFVVQNEVATLRSIQTGRSASEVIEVTDGLHNGDIVATSGHINLSNGSKVELVKK